jgi:hypothetical protein
MIHHRFLLLASSPSLCTTYIHGLLIYEIQAYLPELSVSFNGFAPQVAADGNEQVKYGKRYHEKHA